MLYTLFCHVILLAPSLIFAIFIHDKTPYDFVNFGHNYQCRSLERWISRNKALLQMYGKHLPLKFLIFNNLFVRNFAYTEIQSATEQK